LRKVSEIKNFRNFTFNKDEVFQNQDFKMKKKRGKKTRKVEKVKKVEKTEKSEKKTKKGEFKQPSKKAIHDFEVYAKGVDRLQRLKKELDRLDTRNFRREEHEIRANLNKVHMIPWVENKLKDLKAKIVGIDTDALKEEVDERQTQRIRALEGKALEAKGVEEIPELRKKLAVLKKEFTKVKVKLKEHKKKKPVKKPGKKGLSKAEVHRIELKLLNKQMFLKQGIKELEDKLSKLPDMKRSITALRKGLTEEREDLEEVEEKLRILPGLKRTVSGLRKGLTKEREDLRQEIEKEKRDTERVSKLRDERIRAAEKRITKRSERIPAVERKLKGFSRLLVEKAEEIAKEEGEIGAIKRKIYSLKKELEEKSDELEKEIKEKTSLPARKALLGNIRQLSQKIDANKEELYNKMRESLAESRWALEKEKQELRQELADVVAESRYLIEKQAEDISEQVAREMKKFEVKQTEEKKELQEKLVNRIIQLKTQLNEIEKQRKVQAVERGKEREISRGKEEINIETPMKGRKVEPEMAQPFLPAPKFSEIKITKLKQGGEPMSMVSEFGVPQGVRPEIKIREFKIPKFEDKGDQEIEDSGLSKLPLLPSLTDLSPEFDPVDIHDFKEFNKEEFKLRELGIDKLRDIEKHSDITIEKPEELEKSHKHLLPEIPKEEFIEDVKEAIVKVREEAIHENRALLDEKKKPKIKRGSLFLELNTFRDAESDLFNVRKKIVTFEKDVQESVKDKTKQTKEMTDLIIETEKISQILTTIDKKILSKIKTPESL
jgi:hypothetical protein